MRQQHAPGPWEVSNDTGEWDVSNDECGTVCYQAIRSGETVIGFSVAHSESYFVEPETEANAALMAAAPDLLADLREAAATLRRYEVLHRAKGTEDSAAKAEVNARLAERFEATIAKATGTQS